MLPYGRKAPLPVPPFRSGRRSPVCARIRNKGKAGVQRGRETAGVPSFLSTPRTRQSPALRRAQLPAEVQRKTLRPLEANPLTQFACPGKSVQKWSRPVRANRLRGSCTPAIRCRNGLCPPLKHKKRNPYGFLFEIALPYQDALRTPGIWPLYASSRKQIRQIPKSRR